MAHNYIDVEIRVEFSTFSTFSTFVTIVATFLCLFKCVREITTKDYQLRHVCLSALNNSAPTGRIFMQFGV